MLTQAAASRSGRLLLHGEPGAGRSTLLAHARDRAAALGMAVVHARGAPSESAYAFAGLHQLLHPLRDRLGALPDGQAAALTEVLRPGAGHGGADFLVSVAAQSLLTEAAAERGLLCVVDDAHWLDRPTLDALSFVARRLCGEGIALLMAQRDPVPDQPADPALPRLRLDGLDEEAASGLLTDRSGIAPDPAVVAELVRRTAGNPLTLGDLGTNLSPEQLGGQEPLPSPLPLGEAVERAFLDRVRTLPAATRLGLLVASAEDLGDLPAVLTAATRLGLPATCLDPAEEARIVALDGRRVTFHHPVVRAAVHSRSPATARRRAHAALADVLRPQARDGRRAWHLAAAAVGPDESVAAELADAAQHARARGGHAEAFALLERAARLTPDVDVRARRLYETARAAWEAGRVRQTQELISEAELIVREPDVLGRLLRLRGTLHLRAGVITDAYRTLSRAADCLAASDPEAAARCLVQAAEAASHAGDLDRFHELGAAAARLSPGTPAVRCTHLLLTGMGSVVEGDVAGARALLTRGMEEAVALDDPRLLAWAGTGALYLGEIAQALALYGKVSDRARASDHVGAQPAHLDLVVVLEVIGGRTTQAADLAEQGLRLARETGQENLAAVHRARLALLHALRGNGTACREAAEAALSTALSRRIGLAVATARHALAVLALTRGAYEEALHVLNLLATPQAGTGHPMVTMLSLPDRIEAAVRAGDFDSARDAMRSLEAWQDGTATGEVRALLARSRALLAQDDEEAIARYEEALALHSGSVPLEKARTELYFGERLRRARKRVYARRWLRSAADTLERLQMAPWAERARRELRATGETTRRQGTSAALTPQEVRIARLVAQGHSNREIADQLFLSRRTVEYHLYKLFPKLGVASRADLTQLYYADPALFE
ncbi:LuxR C-terminal-related transcriptional regulator [Streptomyces sp. NPDC059866]|uniref:LuxR C-terminal-related transcriptional regulator n=1 Tax=Streptomyces sp. NPDC059866 TaxID=3346978 RepID=UPI003660C71B